MPPIAKLNLRLPPDLKAQAEAVAAYNGLSLNALCVMALRSYVPYLASKAPKGSGVAGAGLQAPEAPAPGPSVRRQAGVPVVALNAPCPCGSGKKYKRCHGAPAR